MKRLYSLIPLLAALLLFSACDDDPTELPEGWAILDGHIDFEDGTPAADMTVYLARQFMFGKAPIADPGFAVIDSTTTSTRGRYSFEIDRGNGYRIYAEGRGTPGITPVEAWFVSPFSDWVTNNGESDNLPDIDLTVLEEMDTGRIEGRIVKYQPDDSLDPVADAWVFLHPVHGTSYAATDSLQTDAAGEFEFESLTTRNYFVSARHEFDVGERGPVFCDGETTLELGDLVVGVTHVLKPAVYIYPAKAGDFTVLLAPGPGTVITETIPEYGDGWQVHVDTDGRIDDTWDYLFYEMDQGQPPALRDGICLPRGDLVPGLADLLQDIGLIEAEIDEFLAYWLPLLNERPYYGVYPVLDVGIDAMVGLVVEPPPDATLRVWLYFKGMNSPNSLPAPRIEHFERGATTVVEWGGILLD